MNTVVLADTLRLHIRWLKGKPGGARMDLAGASLIGARLYGANLRFADLAGADLYRADLAGANLTGSDLRGANLRRADFTKADLAGADLTGADLTGADLTGADLTGADLTGVIGLHTVSFGNRVLTATEADSTEAKPVTSLDDLLQVWSVIDPAQWENDGGPEGWFAVSNDDGIVAYFGNETDAYRFRLAEINRVLNG